jgi:hypothetical protein
LSAHGNLLLIKGTGRARAVDEIADRTLGLDPNVGVRPYE